MPALLASPDRAPIGRLIYYFFHFTAWALAQMIICALTSSSWLRQSSPFGMLN